MDFTQGKTSSKLFINRSILSNARTDDVVLAAYADTYLSHAAPIQPAVAPPHRQYVFHQAPLDGIEAQKVAVGTFIRLLKDFNELTERLRKNPSNNLLNLLVAEKETEISLQRELIWSVERYSELNLSCEHDFFFEALASNIKGAVISFQTWIKKMDNAEKASIISRLNSLKSDYINNLAEITGLETRLNGILDAETLLKVRSMKLFSCLNSEKPTPIFLSLARSSSRENNLSHINKQNGIPFCSNINKTEQIVSYFENTYRIPLSDMACYDNCIEMFLGDDILNHPISTNSKVVHHLYTKI
jgi:hypothetical protein